MTCPIWGPLQASKHWSGLIADYYAERVKAVQNEAVKAAAAGKPLDAAAVDRAKAALAYAWTTARTRYPTAVRWPPFPGLGFTGSAA